MTEPACPWIAPEVSGRDLVLYKAKAGDMRDVMIAGEWMLRNRRPTCFDLNAAVAKLNDTLAVEPFRRQDDLLD